MDQYTDAFIKHSITFDVLSEMTENDFKELGGIGLLVISYVYLGVSVGHRKQLMKFLQSKKYPPGKRKASVRAAEREVFCNILPSTNFNNSLEAGDVLFVVLFLGKLLDKVSLEKVKVNILSA